MAAQPVFPLTVFYDGSCRVCAREMKHYRRLAPRRRLRFVDISTPGFEPFRYGRTRDEFMRQLHVRDADGRYYLGVDAFPVIWQALPGFGYRFLAGLVRVPGIHLLGRLGYKAFARLRGYLPGEQGSCAGDACHSGGRR